MADTAGHRVVVFSQFTRMLDIIDDYLNLRGYLFARLDGGTNRVQRMVHIQEFNKKNSPYFCFIMSTRAGQCGYNARGDWLLWPTPQASGAL